MAEETKEAPAANDPINRVEVLISKMEKDVIARMEKVEAEQEEFRKKIKVRGVSLPGCDEQKEKFSFHYALRYAAGLPLPEKEDPNAGFTRSVIEQSTQKALDSGTFTAGGAVIPAEYVAQIIDVLRPNVAAFQLGATISQFSGNPVEIPRLDASATAYWTAENAAITASQETFGQVRLTPHELAALVQMSRRSAMLSSPGLEAIARQDIGLLFARSLDLAILKGTGADGQPLGIINQTGVNDFANGWTVSATIDYGGLVGMVGMVEDDNALGTRMGWAMHPKIKRAIQKLVDSNGQPLFQWDPMLSPSGITMTPSILTHPFATTTQLASGATAGELIFGDWASVVVGQWGAMALEASTEAGTAFAAHQLWIKGVMEVGVAVRHPESFVFENGITA